MAKKKRRMKQRPLFKSPKHNPRHAASASKPAPDVAAVALDDPAMLSRGLLVRFTPDEYAMIRRAAYEDAKSSAGYIRNAALAMLGRKLLDMGKAAAKWQAEAKAVVVGGAA